MMDKKQYANGQKIYDQKGDVLTYYFKNGKVKAEGISINGMMEGEWKFYRETGQLWQVGNFKHNQKHGPWIRYDRKDQLEYEENFDNGKLLKK
jgi:antitoxin component YwqK of YwqJK toxin-antitoxin module